MMKLEKGVSKLIKLVVGLWTAVIITTLSYFELEFFSLTHDDLILISLAIGGITAIVLIVFINKIHEKISKYTAKPTVNQMGED